MTLDSKDWVQRLAEKLYTREALYRRAKDPTRRKNEDSEDLRIEGLVSATFALLELTEALAELPIFAGRVGLLPLDELVLALGGLSDGIHSPMLKPLARASKGQSTLQKRYVKKHAVAGVECLIRLDLDEPKAIEIVAKEFGKAGALSRKKSKDKLPVPLTAGSVEKWLLDVRSDSVLKKEVADAVDEWLSGEGAPTSVAEATKLIRTFLAQPGLRTRL